ncbi:hypothetical protein DM02DRAFT_708646 [Periconia macrospinosa]|uniref:Uncharacterized protein n=1 Tax=Periconia macrospinosa TaxID=97972 RepID=A0A2V1DQU4_9PLEO|nr:hypothetical protein DM02DRAFT_708646 [Periconia macrospinosa]
MKASNAIAVAALLSQSQHVQAFPTASALVARSKASIAGSLLELFGALLPEDDGPVETWDYERFPNLCRVYMTTKDGGNCAAEVQCDNGIKKYNAGGKAWSACYVGGESKFNDDRIGEFSIKFAKKDGREEGEGLTTPVLKLKYVGNWKEIPVTELAEENENREESSKGPFICRYANYGGTGLTDHITENRRKKWDCGVPKIGKGGGGLDSNGPTNSRGYRPGTCSIHVVQFQKPDPSKDDYSLEISSVIDDNENKIGGQGKAGADVTLKTKLPKTISIKTGGVDKDPVYFQYGDDKWDSNNEDRCSVGGYDSGNRDMDCTFKCA